MKTILILLVVLALIYAGLVILVYLFQRQMIYYPSSFAESNLLKESAQFGLQPWRNTKGELIGWMSPHLNPPADSRIIVLHGNANHAHWCGYYAEAFQSGLQPHRWDVYLLEYPGYASRPGVPSQHSLVDAALEAIDELKAADKLMSRSDPKTFLLGESIGAAVASQVAAQRPDAVDGMFFIAPFNNLPDLGAHHMPILPVRLLLKDRYASDEALNTLTGPREGRHVSRTATWSRDCPTGLTPIAFLMAGRDEVIPNRFTQKLYDSYPGPKKLWTQPHASHNTLNFDPTEPFWREVGEFLFENSGDRIQKRGRSREVFLPKVTNLQLVTVMGGRSRARNQPSCEAYFCKMPASARGSTLVAIFSAGSGKVVRSVFHWYLVQGLCWSC